MKTRMIGVDIGSTAVRAVEISGTGSDGFAVVSRIGVADLPDGAVVYGKIRKPQIVSLALAKALKAAKLPTYGFVLGISSTEVAVSKVTLPSQVRPAERALAIINRGQEISPNVPLVNARVATNLLRSDVTGEGHHVDTLLAAAALDEEIEQLLNVCRLARATPRAIDIAGAGLLRALVRTVPDAQEVATVVDVGATKTTVVTRQGRHMRSIRVASGGGDDVTRSIQSVTGESPPMAEKRKQLLRLSGAPQNEVVELQSSYGMEEFDDPLRQRDDQTLVEEAFNTAGETLVDTIALSIEHDASNHGSYTQGVSLCGGTALLGGLKERLQQRLGVPVQVGRPWAVIAPHKRNAAFLRDGADDPFVMLSLAPAIGLAMWKEQR